jgi:hypothetical protein
MDAKLNCTNMDLVPVAFGETSLVMEIVALLLRGAQTATRSSVVAYSKESTTVCAQAVPAHSVDSNKVRYLDFISVECVNKVFL